MPKIDIESIPQSNATGYPAPFDKEVEGRFWRRLAPAGRLTQMGASHVVLKPGGWSSQRHWHEGEDELLIMLTGEAILVEDDGEVVVRPGDVLAWPAGVQNGHHLINRTDQDCSFVCVGTGDRSKGGGYSDIDMTFDDVGYYRKDGTPYPTTRLI
jgi:uncharacterized cupin superfamily protein